MLPSGLCRKKKVAANAQPVALAGFCKSGAPSPQQPSPEPAATFQPERAPGQRTGYRRRRLCTGVSVALAEQEKGREEGEEGGEGGGREEEKKKKKEEKGDEQSAGLCCSCRRQRSLCSCDHRAAPLGFLYGRARRERGGGRGRRLPRQWQSGGGAGRARAGAGTGPGRAVTAPQRQLSAPPGAPRLPLPHPSLPAYLFISLFRCLLIY